MDTIDRFKKTIQRIDEQVAQCKDDLGNGKTVNFDSPSATLASTQSLVSRIKTLEDVKEDLIADIGRERMTP